MSNMKFGSVMICMASCWEMTLSLSVYPRYFEKGLLRVGITESQLYNITGGSHGHKKMSAKHGEF
jgi:hypothetical protein